MNRETNDLVEILKTGVEEVYCRGRIDLMDEYYQPDLVFHAPHPFNVTGLELFRETVDAILHSFPDFHEELIDACQVGDSVLAHWVISGTQQGDYSGQRNTGRSFRVHSIDKYHFKDDKIAEHWTGMDFLSMYRQLDWTLDEFVS
jgi:predicted ester cyclase